MHTQQRHQIRPIPAAMIAILLGYPDVELQATAVGALNGSSISSTFEVGSTQQVTAAGWINEQNSRLFDLYGGNGGLIGATAYGDFSALFDTGVDVIDGAFYQLHFDTGFVANLTAGSARYAAAIGTLSSGVFTPFATGSDIRSYRGNMISGVYSAPVLVSGTGSGSGHVAVRLAQAGTLSVAGQSDYFGFDNVVLTVELPGGVPEPATWTMLIAGFGLTGAVLRRRQLVTEALG